MIACMTARRIGRWLLLAGVCLAATGAIAWSREHATLRLPSDPLQAYTRAGLSAAPIGTMLRTVPSGTAFGPPNHTVAALLFAAAGVVALIGSVAMRWSPPQS
jgi:hypothetical protein